MDRFGIKSTESGLIASSYDMASFLCLLPVSYLGGRGTGSKPVWIGRPPTLHKIIRCTLVVPTGTVGLYKIKDKI